ncbi:MAG TPA: NADH-quinone oxidoreductase subunit N, partial [Sulfurovum sp.]|nr:NADH-quinone oxidoreductase subunit N [Sulfurovum sp.]
MINPLEISFESLNMITLAPMLIAIVGALVILIIDLFKEDIDKSLYVMLTLLIILIDLGSVFGLSVNDRGFFDLMLADGLAIITQ